MQINIKSLHFKTDRKLEDFINEKIEKLCSKYDSVVGADVTLKLEKSDTEENKIAEIRIAIRGNDLFAKKQSKTFEESVDLAVDALKKQLIKYKEKLKGM